MTDRLKVKLTERNQGYWDRLGRANSWVSRAQAMESETTEIESPQDLQEVFMMYWIAFNALYGRVNESGHGRYLRPGDDDARWFLGMICDLDRGIGRIAASVSEFRKDAHALLKSKYLSEAYWREGDSSHLKRRLEEETAAAEEALDAGNLEPYLTSLLWGRIRMLRNQVFHGCSTNRYSANKDSAEPAVRVLRALIPAFTDIMKARVDKENEWPRVPFPRLRSPQHPAARHRQ